MECNTSTRGYRRTLVWAREIVWDEELDLRSDALYEAATARLERMGLRALIWWFCDWQDEPYWYAVLERIPGSTGTWRD